MKIILLQNVKKLGRVGDIKEVAEGYARNLLFPKKLAEPATAEGVKNVEMRKAEERATEEAEKKRLLELATKLKNRKISLRMKAKDGKLFGSISAKNIAVELEKEDLAVPENCIILKEVLKKIGTYSVGIRLAKNIDTKIELEVSEE